MGYSTSYKGFMRSDKEITKEGVELLKKIFSTRRVKILGLDEQEYGVEGEFFTDSLDRIKNKKCEIFYNEPPSTQPSLWCDLKIKEDNKTIVWSGVEKTYCFKEWLEYIIKVFEGKYSFSGSFLYQGEDPCDTGQIEIQDNIITLSRYDVF